MLSKGGDDVCVFNTGIEYPVGSIFLPDEEPIGLAVFENSFLWASKIQLFHTSPHAPKKREVLLNTSISAFSVLHKSRQPKSKLTA